MGSRLPSGTTTPSITISPVTEARSDSFPAILGALRPAMPFSRMKPRMAPSWASDLAQTTKTSARGALEIQVFAPVSR